MFEDKSQVGLLSITKEKLCAVLRNDSITNIYDIEDTVFARWVFRLFPEKCE